MTKTLLLALAIGLLAAAPAQADITVSNVTAAPESTAAGAHSNFTLAFDLGGSSSVKDLEIDLPAGFLGNPTVPARCTREQFESDSCPAESKVGTQTVNANIGILGPQDLSGEVFNLVPNAGEPARLGIKLNPPGGIPLLPVTRLESAVRIRSESDFGLTSTIKDIPDSSSGMSIKINRISLTLNADANGGKFTSNPTSCNVATTKLRAVGHDDTTSAGEGSFTPTACDALPYAPKLTAKAGATGLTGPRTSPPLTTIIEQASGEASTKSAVVTLGPPFGPNIDALGGLCSQSAYDSESCPESSHVGDAVAVSPLLPGALSGPVRLVEVPGGLPKLVIYLNGLINIRLGADVSLGQTTTTNTLNGIPDVPLSRFQLSFRGGPGGLLSLGTDLCKAGSTLTASFTAHSGKKVDVSTPAQLEGCPQDVVEPPTTTPRPRASVAFRRLATKSPVMRVSVRRGTGGKKLRAVTVSLPKGIKLRRGSKSTLRLKAKSKSGASRLAATLSGRKLVVSRSLRARVHRHPRLRVKLRVTDAGGAKFTLRRSVKAR